MYAGSSDSKLHDAVVFFFSYRLDTASSIHKFRVVQARVFEQTYYVLGCANEMI